MYNTEIQQELKEVVEKTAKTGIYSKIKWKKHIFNYIKDFIWKNNLQFNEWVYLIINNLDIDFILCPVCKIKNKSFNSLFYWFYKTCWVKCSAGLKEKYELAKKNNLAKYGIDHPMKMKEIKQKIKETCLKKYWVEHSSKVINVQRKKEQTTLENLWVLFPQQSKAVQKTREKNTLIKHGVSHTSRLYSTKLKKSKTCIENYGYSNVLCIPETIKKTRESHLKRNYKKFMLEIQPYVSHNISYEEYSQKLSSWKYNFTCKKCNSEFIDSLRDWHFFNWKRLYLPKCPICFPNEPSYAEVEIYNYLKELLWENIDIIRNSKKIISPYELDIFIPEYNLAIEYDGLMYHSIWKHSHSKFNRTEEELKDYHLKKTLLCKEKWIQLLHIFENEWLDKIKKEVWKKIILNLLSLNKNYTWQIQIKELDFQTWKDYINSYTLEWNVDSITQYLWIYSDKNLLLDVFWLERKTITRYTTNNITLKNILYYKELERYRLKLNLRYTFYDTCIPLNRNKKILKPTSFYFKESKSTHLLSEQKKDWDDRKIYDSGYLLIT